jgi:hypothetical protein
MSISNSNSITSSTTLIPIERPLIMRALDYPGYVPINGSVPTGIIRIVISVTGVIIAGVGALFTCLSRNKCEKCLFIAKYLLDEVNRGVTEIKMKSYSYDREMTPDLSLTPDKDSHFIKEVMPGYSGAFGKYIYQIENEGMRYSINRYNNNFKRVANNARRELYASHDEL